MNELKQERLFNITYLQQQHGITPHHVDVLHRRATLRTLLHWLGVGLGLG